MLSIRDGSESKRPRPNAESGYANGGVGGALKLLFKPWEMCMADDGKLGRNSLSSI